MDALRTPEDRFAELPDFAYTPRYIDRLPGFAGLRMAYIDAGAADADRTFLCLHGEPTWGYLYRKMMPGFIASGARVVVPDMFGFGRSDKPTKVEDYSFHFHRDSLLALVEHLDLRNITLVVQDWGGLLGLTFPVDSRFRPRLARLLVLNTAIAVGLPPSDGFVAWRAYNAAHPDLAVGKLIARGTPMLSTAEVAAYDAPFPDVRYKSGVRAFPDLVMTDASMPGVVESQAAITFWSTQWDGPTFMAVGAADPVLGTGPMAMLRRVIRGCPDPMVLADGGHFIQEWGAPVATAALRAFGDG